MSTAAFSTPLENRIERLLCGLPGVVSARVVAEAGGAIEEIHVLATERLHPKQVVRNVESALSAGLGLDVDRRVISVAQIRGDVASTAGRARPPAGLGSTPEEPAGSGPEPAPPAPDRIIFVRFNAQSDAAGQTTCSVVLRRGTAEFDGSGTGPNSTQRARCRSRTRAVPGARERARK